MSPCRAPNSNTLKAFVTRCEERYRPPYGRHEVNEPRQCVFVGTTNNDDYLKDETGGRRFWPVKCGELDLDGLTHDRDMLFAEAMVLFNKGVQWWPERDFEVATIKPHQAARYQGDAWEKAVREYVGAGRADVTVAECAVEALGIELGRLNMSDQLRITKILKVIGLKRTHTRRGNVWNKA